MDRIGISFVVHPQLHLLLLTLMLTLALSRIGRIVSNSLLWLVTPEGFEPSTYGLEVRRSSIELWGLPGHGNTGSNASTPPDVRTKNWIRIRVPE